MGKNKNHKNNSSAKPKSPVLADHKKVGKRLIPPMLQIGGMTPTYFDRDTVPELVWLALVEQRSGLRLAAQVAEAVGNFAKTLNAKRRFITLSEMNSVLPEEWSELRAYLSTQGLLVHLLGAVHDLVLMYPECPMRHLFETQPTSLQKTDFLKLFEDLVGELMEKRGRRAVLMQANAIYILTVQGKLFINEGLSLGNFEALPQYPDTEESRMVGASVCAASSMVVSILNDNEVPTWSWPTYFWQRNLELLPVKKFIVRDMRGRQRSK